MKKAVCGCFGTIYYAQILKNGMMSHTNRVDITESALLAVADHIMQMKDYTDNEGFAGYEYNKTDGGRINLVVFDADKYKIISQKKLDKLKQAANGDVNEIEKD